MLSRLFGGGGGGGPAAAVTTHPPPSPSRSLPPRTVTIIKALREEARHRQAGGEAAAGGADKVLSKLEAAQERLAQVGKSLLENHDRLNAQLAANRGGTNIMAIMQAADVEAEGHLAEFVDLLHAQQELLDAPNLPLSARQAARAVQEVVKVLMPVASNWQAELRPLSTFFQDHLSLLNERAHRENDEKMRRLAARAETMAFSSAAALGLARAATAAARRGGRRSRSHNRGGQPQPAEEQKVKRSLSDEESTTEAGTPTQLTPKSAASPSAPPDLPRSRQTPSHSASSPLPPSKTPNARSKGSGGPPPPPPPSKMSRPKQPVLFFTDPFKFKVQMEMALNPPLRDLPRARHDARAKLVAEYISLATKVSPEDFHKRLEEVNRIIDEVKRLVVQYAKNMIWRSNVTRFLDVLNLASGSLKLNREDIEKNEYPLRMVKDFEKTVFTKKVLDRGDTGGGGLLEKDAVPGDPLKHLRIACMKHPDLDKTLRLFLEFLAIFLKDLPKKFEREFNAHSNLTVAGPNDEDDDDEISKRHPGLLYSSRRNAPHGIRLKASAIEGMVGQLFDLFLETKLSNVREELMRVLKDKEAPPANLPTSAATAYDDDGRAKQGYSGNKRAKLLALPFARRFLLLDEAILNTADWTGKLLPSAMYLLKQDRVATPRELWALQCAHLQKIHLRCHDMLKYSLFTCNEPTTVCNQILPFILEHFGDAGRRPPQKQQMSDGEEMHAIQRSTTAWLIFLQNFAKIKGLPLTYREWDSSEIVSAIRYRNIRHIAVKLEEMKEAFNAVILDGKEAGGGYDAKLRRYFDNLFEGTTKDDGFRPEPYHHAYFQKAYVVLLVMQGLHELLDDCSAIPPPQEFSLQ